MALLRQTAKATAKAAWAVALLLAPIQGWAQPPSVVATGPKAPTESSDTKAGSAPVADAGQTREEKPSTPTPKAVKDGSSGGIPGAPGPVPSTAAVPEAGSELTQETGGAILESESTAQYGGFFHTRFMLVSGIGAVAFAFIIIVLVLLRRRSNASEGYEEPDMGNDNRYPKRPNLVSDPRDSIIESLQRKIVVIEQRLTALENGASGRADRQPAPLAPQQVRPAYGPGDAAPGSNTNFYDRKHAPQQLPEDGLQPNPGAWAKPFPDETPTVPAPTTGSLQALADELADLFNRAGKPEFDALAAKYGAESYTNERRGDLSQLIKDPLDRFWIVPVPGRPDIAVMIPGFTLKKAWARLRQPTSDHPLSHHFDMLRGETLQVIRPAVLRRNTNNFWELLKKGEITGIS